MQHVCFGLKDIHASGLAGHADLMLIGMHGPVGVVVFDAELEIILQIVSVQEADGGGCVVVVLVKSSKAYSTLVSA